MALSVIHTGEKLYHSKKLLGIFWNSPNLAFELGSEGEAEKTNKQTKEPHILDQGSGVMLLKFLFVSKVRRYPDE